MRKPIHLIFNSRWLSVALLCCLSFVGCTSEPGAVNNRYINSEMYKEFHNEIKNEVHLRLQNTNHLQMILQQSYKCDKGERLFPNKSIALNKVTNSNNINDCSSLGDSTVSNFNAYTIGYFKFHKLQLRWLIIENQLLNSRRQLLMAVYSKGELTGYQSLASIRNNLLLNVSASFRLWPKSEKLIVGVSTTRKVDYPIRQQKDTQINYSVNQDGAITVIKSESN